MAVPIDDSQSGTPGEPPNGPASPPAESLEVEVKFLVRDLDAVRARLRAAGATPGAPRVYERNVRYDTVDGALLARQVLLRLRQDTRTRLTFKGPAPQDAASEAKVREEVEVVVDDFDRMAHVLGRLGFAAVQRYEKYRETHHWRDVEVVLDELPFGHFVELEGPSEASLKAAAAALGLDWSRRVLANYLALMELARRTFGLPFSDLTFDNFQNHPAHLEGLLPLCAVEESEAT